MRRRGAMLRRCLVCSVFVALLVIAALRGIPSPRRAAAQATTPATAPSAVAFTVVTANMRMAMQDDGPNDWRQRRDLAVRTILAATPEIVGCQEVTPAQGAYLAAHLAPLSPVVPNHYDTGALGLAGDAMAALTQLYVRTDRWNVLAAVSGMVRPDAIQNPLSENAMYELAVLQNTAHPAIQIIVIDVHLRHGMANATAGAKKLRAQIAALEQAYPGAAALVMGDLNHDRTSPAIQALTAAPDGLRDTFDYAHMPADALWGTYHAFTGISHARWPSDLILVQSGSGGGAVDATFEPAVIMRDHDATGRYPSDHFFVKAVVHLAG